MPDSLGPRPQQAATGAAPGKVILFGEHSVVHGRPAVAAALAHGLGATAEHDPEGPVLHIPRWQQHVRPNQGLDAISRAFAAALSAAGMAPDAPVAVTLDGALPMGVGLGSSAAFAVSLLRALGAFRGESLDEATLIEGAAQVEAVFHGNPSGLDHTVVCKGGCLAFTRGTSPTMRAVTVGARVPLVVGWARREGTTREVVEAVAARLTTLPSHYERLLDAMGDVARAGIAALEAGDLPALGALFDLNHGYLNALGVSSVANERMVELARDAGALGAKLTGAGRGGAIIALVPEGQEGVVAALQQGGFSAFSTRLG